jgi:hypothetical protein
MLRGETLRGVNDTELAGMTVPVTIIPRIHPTGFTRRQRSTECCPSSRGRR